MQNGIERLTSTERAYLLIFNEVLDKGNSLDRETLRALLLMGHVEEYGETMKLTDSGFQLLDFLNIKMGDKKLRLLEA